MSDYDKLKCLLDELMLTLDNRIEGEYIDRTNSRAKIRRLRIGIQDVLVRIESQCNSFLKVGNEKWR